MARKYLVLQQEIFNLRQRKTTLEEKLSQAEKLERIGNQRYQSKIQELESKRVSGGDCGSIVMLLVSISRAVVMIECTTSSSSHEFDSYVYSSAGNKSQLFIT